MIKHCLHVIWETSLSVNNILNGEIVKFWSKNQINKVDEMMNTTKAIFDVKALTKYLISIKLIPDPDLIKLISEEDKLKLKTTKYASCWFNILKILIKSQFYNTGDATYSESSYLNKLFGTIKAHSTSKLTKKRWHRAYQVRPAYKRGHAAHL